MATAALVRLLKKRFGLSKNVKTRVRGTSSPSRSFREPVHLSAFLFALFPNVYESNI